MQLRSASSRAASMPRSAIREVMALAAERQNVIHLEVGEPDFGTPEHIVSGACDALRDGWTRYAPNAGLPRLRELIARRASERGGTQIDADRICVTVGAVGALFTAVAMVAEAGDEVLIPDPGWPNYYSIVHLIGATPVRFPMPARDGFVPDPAQVEALVSPRTKAIMINTPGNPTGVVFGESTMRALAEIAERHGLYVISDEIYEDIVFQGAHLSMAGVCPADRVFIVSGVSKSYAMTGWRLGYLVCPPGMAGMAAAIQEPLVSCAPTVSQKAAEVALSGPQGSVDEARAIFRRRRDVVLDVLGNTGLLLAEPSGAFYALVGIGGHAGKGSVQFAKDLLVARNVATVPGVTFGPSCDNAVRIAFTTGDEDLRDGLERLRAYIDAA